jgi:hypothetical protein
MFKEFKRRENNLIRVLNNNILFIITLNFKPKLIKRKTLKFNILILINLNINIKA